MTWTAVTRSSGKVSCAVTTKVSLSSLDCCSSFFFLSKHARAACNRWQPSLQRVDRRPRVDLKLCLQGRIAKGNSMFRLADNSRQVHRCFTWSCKSLALAAYRPLLARLQQMLMLKVSKICQTSQKPAGKGRGAPYISKDPNQPQRKLQSANGQSAEPSESSQTA